MRLTTCIHFNGIQNVCGAGLDLDPLRVLVTEEERVACGSPFRALWPCHKHGEKHGLACEHRRYPTPEEVAKDEAEIERAMAALMAGRSPCCDAPLEKQESSRSTVSYCSKCSTFVSRERRKIGEPRDAEITP